MVGGGESRRSLRGGEIKGGGLGRNNWDGVGLGHRAWIILLWGDFK